MPKKTKDHLFTEDTRVFKGGRFDVHCVQFPVRETKIVSRHVVVHPGAVVILPLLNQTEIIMIRNYRFAVGTELWELPAGTLEADEEPAETASRELREETGYSAKNIEAMTMFYTTPGFCNELMHAYVATDLSFVGQSLEENEDIKVEIITWAKALEMIGKAIIRDGKTIATLLFYQYKMQLASK